MSGRRRTKSPNMAVFSNTFERPRHKRIKGSKVRTSTVCFLQYKYLVICDLELAMCNKTKSVHCKLQSLKRMNDCAFHDHKTAMGQ